VKKLLLILALVALGAVAPHIARAQDGGTMSPFSIGAGSRSISLGRAFVTLADDASAPYWNPAALRNVQQMQFMAMYLPSLYGDYFGADYAYFGFVYPTLSAGAFGIGYTALGTTFDRYDEDHRPEGEGNYSESQLLISYAAERHVGWFFGTLAAGASFKINRQTVDPFSSTAPGVDVGFIYTPDAARSLKFALHLQDAVAPQYKLDLGDTVSRTIMTGAGYTHAVRERLGAAAAPAVRHARARRRQAPPGRRVHVLEVLSLRAGYDDGTPTFGLGIGTATTAWIMLSSPRMRSARARPSRSTRASGPRSTSGGPRSRRSAPTKSGR
jgi:hypothetical protein